MILLRRKENQLQFTSEEDRDVPYLTGTRIGILDLASVVGHGCGVCAEAQGPKQTKLFLS